MTAANRVTRHIAEVANMNHMHRARIPFVPSSVFLLLLLGWNAVVNEAHAQAVRRDIKTLNAGSREIQALERAIAAMKRLPASDPHSWDFQANIHGIAEGTPNPHPAWAQCQHANWWFFPWHRAYLHYFERIIRRYSGDPMFALPYWNYSDPLERALPALYRNPASNLFDPTRRPSVNNGTDMISEFIVVQGTNQGLALIPFADFNPRVTTFGGPALRAPQHAGSTFGALENIPHNWIHGFVGGNMGSPASAARDPIFWAHHANVDRIWEVWLQMGNGRANPADPIWLDQTFLFYDENKQPVRVPIRQVIDTTALGYVYDTVGTPTPRSPQPTGQTNFVTVASLQTDRPQPVSPSLTVKLTPTAAARGRFELRHRHAEGKYYLCFEEVKFSGAPDSCLAVYLNSPQGQANLAPHDPHFAGYLSYFGHDDHGTGHCSTLDVTGTVARLKNRQAWKLDEMYVTVQRVMPGIQRRPTTVQCSFGKLNLFAEDTTPKAEPTAPPAPSPQHLSGVLPIRPSPKTAPAPHRPNFLFGTPQPGYQAMPTPAATPPSSGRILRFFQHRPASPQLPVIVDY